VSKIFRPRGYFLRSCVSPGKSLDVSRFPATTCDQPRSRSRASDLKQRHREADLIRRLCPQERVLSLPNRDTPGSGYDPHWLH